MLSVRGVSGKASHYTIGVQRHLFGHLVGGDLHHIPMGILKYAVYTAFMGFSKVMCEDTHIHIATHI